MDAHSQPTSPQSTAPSPGNHFPLPLLPSMSCALCQTTLRPPYDDSEMFAICGDCKFLLEEDLGTPLRDTYQTTRTRGRTRTRFNNSESIESIFSQHLLQMIDILRQSRSTPPNNEDQSPSDAFTRLVQRSSSRTTPSGSRRWQRGLSDTDSEGFDNTDSLFGETETNLSSNRYRFPHGDSDVISLSAYGADSDVSVDGHSVLESEMFILHDDGSSYSSDTDIDPMHTGLNQWNSDQGEDLDEDDGEWEEADNEEDVAESVQAGIQLQNFVISTRSESTSPLNYLSSRFPSSRHDSPIHWQFRLRRRYEPDVLSDVEGSDIPQYVRNSDDYIDAGGFDELLEHLAETESLRRGAPPAAVSFVNSLPRLFVNKEHERLDGVACAICKDTLVAGVEVNQLPCRHLYHPSCILPWLRARNSCPLCRYELPTDDKEYEDWRSSRYRAVVRQIQQHNVTEDGSYDVSEGADADEAHELGHVSMEQLELNADPVASSSGGERNRTRWLFLAAPIAGVVGIALVLWLGSPQGGCPSHHHSFPQIGRHQINVPPSSQPNQSGNRSRRWWSLF